MIAVTKTVGNRSDCVIASDQFSYTSHPHCVRLTGQELLIVFNQSVRRNRVRHPPSDPLVRNYTVRSPDLGETWLPARVVPDYDWSGVECASLTRTGDGVLLLNQWRFRWLPAEDASGKAWERAPGGSYVHRSTDDGRTWDDTVALDVSPFSGGYGIRGAVGLMSGELLLPLSDAPNYAVVFGVKSADGGRSWQPPALIAQAEGRLFEEPAAAVLDDGTVLMMLRESVSDHLFQCRSRDGGASWTEPTDTGISGCPPHLCQLADGRLLCTYGFRYFPYEIRCVLSGDGGVRWSEPITIRTSLGSMDIGYPCSVELTPGRILTVYYGPLIEGTSAILGTAFDLP
jgi:BNR repeat-like domain